MTLLGMILEPFAQCATVIVIGWCAWCLANSLEAQRIRRRQRTSNVVPFQKERNSA